MKSNTIKWWHVKEFVTLLSDHPQTHGSDLAETVEDYISSLQGDDKEYVHLV